MIQLSPTDQEPIVLIDDDADDILFFQSGLLAAGCTHPLISFSDSVEALNYLQISSELPLMIVADMVMPKLTGIDLRARLRESKRVVMRCVPFFFLSTNCTKAHMDRAFGMMIQGAFIKPSDQQGMAEVIGSMLRYCSELSTAA